MDHLWLIYLLKRVMIYLLKMVMFQGYVKLPHDIIVNQPWIL